MKRYIHWCLFLLLIQFYMVFNHNGFSGGGNLSALRPRCQWKLKSLTPWGVVSCLVTGDRRLLHTFTDKALDVEVFVLDPERLPFAGLPTVLTGDRSSSSLLLLLLLLLQRAVDSLLLKHCRRQTVDFRSYSSTHKKFHRKRQKKRKKKRDLD